MRAMSWRPPAIVTLAATAVALGGCGGNGNGGGEADGQASGACAAAKTALRDTVAERDRLFVDQQLGAAAKACEGELEAGTTEACTAARADLEAAAAEVSAPPDLESRVDAAVAACVGTTITSTIPAP
jgi:hypothetical protein